MALAANVVTLADLAKRLDPDHKIARIIEILNQTNEILEDMVWKEGNLITGHRTTVRTGLPTVAWRLLNGGVLPSKSTTAQLDEGCGKLEAWSEVDVALAKISGNVNEFRLSEAVPFMEAMNQEMAATLIYGNSSVSPEEFTGLAARYSSLSAANAQNIVNGNGSGASDMTSVWLIVWGESTIHGIYPKGSTAGLEHKDLGEETVENAGGVTGAKMRAYRDQFIWDCGIALRDWRYVVRICNIDVSTLVAQSGQPDLINLMIKALWRIPNIKAGKAAFYMNRTVGQYLDIQRKNDVKAGGQLSYDVVDGKNVMNFRGIPFRIVDAILETEAVLS